MSQSDPKYERKLEDLERRVLDRPGVLDPTVRRSVGEGGQPPHAVAVYVDKVRRHGPQARLGRRLTSKRGVHLPIQAGHGHGGLWVTIDR